MNINYNNRVFGLDLMRALAILLVVIAHSFWIFPNSKNLWTDILSLAGVLGVEIFFVLSGFLIGRIVYKSFVNENYQFTDLLYFWVRRWFRTFPNYYLILLVNIGIVVYLGYGLPNNLWQYFFFLQNFHSEMPRFFSESWSLPIEEFAYIIGPLLLYMTIFVGFKIQRSVLFGILTLIIIMVFITTKIIYNNNVQETSMMFWNVNVKAITIYRIDAIYYGVLAAWISLISPKFWLARKHLGFMLGLLIFIGLNFAIPTQKLFIETHPFFWNVLYLPINSIAIAFCLPLLSSIISGPRIIRKPITVISLISYSMYLLHYSVVLRLLKIIFPTTNLTTGELVGYFLLYMISTILMSLILYRFFEKPLMDIRDKPYLLRWFKTK